MKALVKYSFLDDRDERIYAQQEVEIPTERDSFIEALRVYLVEHGAAPHDFAEMRFEFHEVHIPSLMAAEVAQMTLDNVLERVRELEENNADLFRQMTEEAERADEQVSLRMRESEIAHALHAVGIPYGDTLSMIKALIEREKSLRATLNAYRDDAA